MCGRFTLRANLKQLQLQFAAASLQGLDWKPRYNLAPTQSILAVRPAADAKTRELVSLRWGLVPSWANDLKIGASMINARSESVAEKPSFRTAFKKRRCLILADGFYEWKTEGKNKQPFFIRRRDDQPFAFAGLWELWSKDESPIESGTIITTEPNELMATLHDRMPVILDDEAAALWLDHSVEDPEQLLPLLAPYPDGELEAYAVDKMVGSPKNESPQCAKPLGRGESEQGFEW